MYLTRMRVDLSKNETMKALTSPNLFHGAVESAFKGERKRCLWRIDELNANRFILLLSQEKPDLTAAARQFGFDGAKLAWETRDYEPLLQRVEKGGVWNFRLTANPIKNHFQKGEHGAVHAYNTAKDQEQWLLDRANAHGFALQPGNFLAARCCWQIFCKGYEHRKVTFLAVTYEGTLTVTDEELFRQTLVSGIGRGKAYGMGLLTIVRPSANSND